MGTHFTRTSLFCLLVLPLLYINGATAQQVVFTAQASAPKIGLKDQLEVTYTIRDAQNLTTLTPGGFSGFKVVAGPFQSQSSSFNQSGNRTVQSSSVSLTYVLQPPNVGTFTFPMAVARDAAGHAYQSNTVSVQVVPGSLAPQRSAARQQMMDPWGGQDPFGGDPFAALHQRMAARARPQQQAPPPTPTAAEINKDLFIKVSVDKTSVHVGEQVTASYKLYARIPMQVGISRLPSLNGFWTQDFEIPKEAKPTEEIVNGKKYQVFLLKKSALFPQQTGALTLDPAEAEGNARIIQQSQQRNPFADLFDNDPAFRQAFGGSLMMNDPLFNNDFFGGYSYRDVPVHLKSQPVKIDVQPLPTAMQPQGYGGAVGSFTISGGIDRQAISTDDVATIKLTITGSGNLKLMEAPRLSLPNGLEALEPQVSDTITGRSTTISGSKSITYTITPRLPGSYQIPPIAFSYFNPATHSYTTLGTQGMRLDVKPGAHYRPVTASAATAAPADIHPIITATGPHEGGISKAPVRSPVFWSLIAVPMLAFAGAGFYRRREAGMAVALVSQRHRFANKIALKRLKTAARLLQENKPSAFYEEVAKAAWLYLSDKLRIPLSALSKEAAFAVLQQRAVSPQLLQNTAGLLDDCEQALYAPGGVRQMQQTYDGAVALLSQLEEQLPA